MASALPPLYAHRLGCHYGPDSSAALEFAPDAIGTDRPHELRAGAETVTALALQPC